MKEEPHKFAPSAYIQIWNEADALCEWKVDRKNKVWKDEWCSSKKIIYPGNNFI